MFTANHRSLLSLLQMSIFVVGAAGLSQTQLVADEPTSTPNDQATLLETFRKEFVAITPGMNKFPAEFQFGPSNEPSAVKVTLNRNFEISKYETYQSIYESVMGQNPSRWKSPRNAVETVSYDQAMEFCAKATELMRAAKLINANEIIRLPTEIEWEYCAKAGTSTVYSFGDDPRAPDDAKSQASILNEYGWYSWNSKGKNPAVGDLKPNPWGLYDFHGNYWEICGDEWTDSLAEVAAEPHKYYRKTNEKIVLSAIRGGCWRDHYSMLRSAARTTTLTMQTRNWIGFRCVLIKESTK